MSELIEGLPDAIALICIAWIPYYFYPKLELVSRSWREAIRSTELLRARKELGSSEDLLCVSSYEPENLWQVYDPLGDRWLTLPILPSKISRLAKFGVVSLDQKLFVLGGGSDSVDYKTGDRDGCFATNEVWVYDFVTRRWTTRAPMLVARSLFACCVLDGNIIVAGGLSGLGKGLSQAEVYDPDKNTWNSIPDLHDTLNSACIGFALQGKVHVYSYKNRQVLDKSSLEWLVEEFPLPGPATVLNDDLYVIRDGNLVKQGAESWKPGSLEPVVSVAHFSKRLGFGMIGLKDEIYIIGGVNTELHWDMKPLPDVDILRIKSREPTWRKASAMTKCCGSVLGCVWVKI